MGKEIDFHVCDVFFDGDRTRCLIPHGDGIRKTTERLNDEWLKKMWKASDDDFLVFRFEQIRRKFENADGIWPYIGSHLDKICELV